MRWVGPADPRHNLAQEGRDAETWVTQVCPPPRSVFHDLIASLWQGHFKVLIRAVQPTYPGRGASALARERASKRTRW